MARLRILALFAMFLGTAESTKGDDLGGGGPMHRTEAGQCISNSQRQAIEVRIAEYKSRQLTSSPIPRGSPDPLSFFPLAGSLWRDLFVFNYVDIDPSGGILDWDCTAWTYDGHDGSDTDIRSFGEQLIGVPVFAAQDGVVIDSHDGEPDMNTEWAGQPANYVIIDHESGRDAWYFHLKNGSVAVGPSDAVSAGQQIGLCASSGISTGPHLHFELRDNGAAFEPFSGPCQPDPTAWAEQPAIDRSAYLQDFGVTYENINLYGPWPNRWPNSGQIALTDTFTRIWWYGTALPVGSTWRVVFVRPNGTIAFNGPNQAFGNPVEWRWYNWWWSYNITDMHTTTGTWHVRLIVNGVQMIEAPIEVRTTRTPDFNRAPEPITVSMEPSSARDGDVIACRVATSLTLDDADYDLLRYNYVWTVDSLEVRNVTTAAHSDVLSRDHVSTCGEITCTVTARDASAAAIPALASTRIRPIVPLGDTSGNGLVGAEDIPGFVSLLLLEDPLCINAAVADMNWDSLINADDIQSFVEDILN
jgi:hypothetical protein